MQLAADTQVQRTALRHALLKLVVVVVVLLALAGVFVPAAISSGGDAGTEPDPDAHAGERP